ncbi:cystathionine beta-lyase [Halobacillus karajensis]|uniref:cysteine-S-conjugate beta-lyase n=1 Tax=Halobacillus karajensis TaxID=195088 RepID=A0A024P966_9BACI|nr:cystathionine beta-lyase [Halobacillus karajensis]CDQ21458.1 Cystathionine beta-lyase MetC [Halobacillus karajensis]CDQ25393.1 Cystathionine beta-lyase MetC [Halobacillus karajensis]CDQ29717.1 Cystathionine beta-lyase MetC [Halobacillus karajensis]SEI07862.1 cystathionine beta-lyase [Halobacillus karajensis]
MTDHSLQTRLLHSDYKFDPQTGAVSVPIQQASTFHQQDFDNPGDYDYSRSGNPTRKALEDTIASLENGTNGYAFASGMAAISTAFMLLSKGDHVVITQDVYGGTFRMIHDVLGRFGIDHTFVDMTDLHEVATAIQPNTKLIYIETPSNPTLEITDIRAVTKLAKAHNCWTFVDNTFMTPALQRPLDLGADLVLHSATKFIAGHSDVVAGLAATRNTEIAKQLGFLQNSFGSILGAHDCWLVLRGLKTLHCRITQSSASAAKIAENLSNHPLVEHVYYPGFSCHPGNSTQTYQAEGAGAVLSFRLKDEESVRQFTKHVELPVYAVSLGAVESILSYPARMSHASMPKQERNKRGITDGLLRLSVGLENPDDLIRDFQQALEKIETHAYLQTGG